jgi:hypothetical protein
MSVNFPNSPSTNQFYSNGNRSWTWTGIYWKATSATVGYAGSAGPKGESSFTYSDTPPANPTVGDRWYNSADALEVVWTNDGVNTHWVEIAASGYSGQTGFTGSRGIDGQYAAVGYTGSASTVIGYSGSGGYSGSRGYPGYVGSASTALGYTGSRGIPGNQGDIGSLGYVGSAGYTGSQGSIGKSIAAAIIFGG